MASPPRTVSAPPAQAQPSDLVGFYAWTGESYRVPEHSERVIIGREGGTAARLDVALPDHEVSSMHCIVERHPDGRLVLQDCSKNGSVVNGARLHRAAVEFHSGDTIQLGQTKLVVLRATGPDFGPGPHSDDVIKAAFRFYQSIRSTAENLANVSYHRVRSVIVQR